MAGRKGEATAAAVAERVAEWREARTIAVLAVVYALLEFATFAAFAQLPTAESSPEQVAAFRAWSGGPLVTRAAVTLLPFVAVAFLWWSASLRRWLLGHGHSVNGMLADVQLGAGICYIALVFVAAGAASAAVAGRVLGGIDVGLDVEQGLTLFGRAVLVIFAMRMAALFAAATARLGNEAGLLPRWFLVVSLATALALFLVPTLNPWLVLVFPVWALLLAAVIQLGRGRQLRQARQAVGRR